MKSISPGVRIVRAVGTMVTAGWWKSVAILSKNDVTE
jgi:hypothetical protein